MSNDTPRTDSPMTGSTNRLIVQTEGWTPAQYCAKWAALERELAALRAKLATKLWECPECMFTFDAGHTNQDGTYSCPECEVGKLRAKLAEAEQRAEAAEKDAGRYRWLRHNKPDYRGLVAVIDLGSNVDAWLCGEQLDAAIDASRGAK